MSILKLKDVGARNVDSGRFAMALGRPGRGGQRKERSEERLKGCHFGGSLSQNSHSVHLQDDDDPWGGGCWLVIICILLQSPTALAVLPRGAIWGEHQGPRVSSQSPIPDPQRLIL